MWNEREKIMSAFLSCLRDRTKQCCCFFFFSLLSCSTLDEGAFKTNEFLLPYVTLTKGTYDLDMFDFFW